MKEIIKVAAYILEKDGKFLVEQRHRKSKRHPLAIVFPGGKLEGNETFEEALVREMKEELDIEISKPIQIYKKITYNEPEEQEYHFRWFTSESYFGDIKNHTAERLIWITAKDKDKFTFEVSVKAFESYLEYKDNKNKRKDIKKKNN